MPDHGLSKSDLKAIREVLGQFPEVEQGIIFGSRAKGTHKNGSDVDLALKGSELTFEQATRISYLLNEETLMPYKFDVVQYETIKSDELIDHIDRVGITIYNFGDENPFIGSRPDMGDVDAYVRNLRKGREL